VSWRQAEREESRISGILPELQRTATGVLISQNKQVKGHGRNTLKIIK